jgi:hypothetical protein
MSRESDHAFYRRRLSEERRRAEMAEVPQLRQLHAWWARLYEDRLRGKGISFQDAIMGAFRRIE